MDRTLLSALVAAVMLPGVVLASRAAAMPAPIASAPGIATAHVAPVQEAAIVCGGNGCAPAQTRAIQKRKFHPLGHA
jgi:hypothetical protein